MKTLLVKMDRQLLFLTIIMFAFGLLMIFSASSVKAAVHGSPYYIFLRHAIALIISFITSIFIILTPTKIYKKIVPIALYAVIIALLFVFAYGTVINSVKRWIDLGFFNIQPSEFAKTILIVYMGVYYYQHKNSTSYFVIFKPLLYGILICFLTFIQPDLGTMSIIFGIITLIFLSLPINKKIKATALQIAIGGILIVILFLLLNGKQILKEGQLSRFNFLNPCQRYTENTGYQVCNGFIAINNGGLFGVGLGNSTQKFLYLPAAYTDFIYPVIVEELGLIVGILIIMIYIYILYRIMVIAYRSYNLMCSVIAYGVTVYILLHIIVNLVGVLGIFALTGSPLPFLSYGGSYTLNLAICLAIVQRIEIENKIYYQKKLLKTGK